ncbi:glycosyltransferase [Desulfocucumis palustris]|uniref:4,4'-diaponeurosporenoate glycosyltransferase n=1 Tax=Desulfocucumis palustris TaxID=1898651 RepID=A0A2L2XEQ4_9FIRM|nr:glycosyltransferase [Desulfocucumis palustris]GBF34718.1 glycosyltransferase [Desulfocucumis palustris]
MTGFPANVTVVLPTKNEEKNIPGFLASLPADIPLIVLDDSTDSTQAVIRSLRSQNTRIITMSAGVAAKRQCGAELAGSDWVLFTDADIQFAPEYFHKLKDSLKGDLVYGPKLSAGKKHLYYYLFYLGQVAFSRMGIPAASASNMIVRRQVFMDIGGFDINLSCNEDTDLVFRLARANYNFRWEPGLLVYNTDHRRLRRGIIWRYGHIMSRTLLIYLNLKHAVPRSWLYSDWGYWG